MSRRFLRWFVTDNRADQQQTECCCGGVHVFGGLTLCRCVANPALCLQRQQQAELLRMLRAEEAQARFDYIRSRAAEVSEQDKVRREELARRLEVRQWSGRLFSGGCASLQAWAAGWSVSARVKHAQG
jgi:hypothetical protein